MLGGLPLILAWRAQIAGRFDVGTEDRDVGREPTGEGQTENIHEVKNFDSLVKM